MLISLLIGFVVEGFFNVRDIKVFLYEIPSALRVVNMVHFCPYRFFLTYIGKAFL
jgi:hypothetical protein